MEHTGLVTLEVRGTWQLTIHMGICMWFPSGLGSDSRTNGRWRMGEGPKGQDRHRVWVFLLLDGFWNLCVEMEICMYSQENTRAPV